MAEAGRQRALTNINKHLSRHDAVSTPAGIAMARRAILPVAQAITEWTTYALGGGPGRKNSAALLLEGVDPELAAFLAVRATISACASNATLQMAAKWAGERLDGELRAAKFEDLNPGLYHAIVNGCAARGTAGPRVANSLHKAASKFALEIPGWTKNQRTHVGNALVELTVATLDVAVIIRADEGTKSPYRLYFAEGADVWFERFNAASMLTRPLNLPSVIPPAPWVELMGGGYYTSATLPVPIITGNRPGQIERLQTADMTKVYAALNAVQDTSWRINNRVLEVMQHAWDHGLVIGEMPERGDEPVIKMPGTVASLPSDNPERAKWKRAMRDVHAKNVQNASKRYTFDRRLRAATDFKGFPEFYFPQVCDFRGRVYSRCDALNPQGDDTVRSLLEFAVGKPLGNDQGPTWFAIHGANLYGNDKVSLADREAWSYAHSTEMCDVARDPLTNRMWVSADKPWSFLAFCFEWGGYIANGYEHVSHMPVALDGTCNGLQHFAAMLRDQTTGEAVNLVPGETPQDIYQRVADMVTRLLVDHPKDQDKGWMATEWLRMGVSRKITKRPVMVLPYGGTFRSCQAYVIDAFEEMGENPFGEQSREACTFLAQLVWQAMGEVVVAGRRAMDFIQGVARSAARVNAPLLWTTPSGFKVYQAYHTDKEGRVETRFNGTIRKFVEYKQTDKIDVRRQTSASSPNFVHSLDAAAMVLTINAATTVGITHFAMIHDSYGTHASDTQALAVCLRAEFVQMYQDHDVLGDLLSTAQEGAPTGTDWPELPCMGNLDIELVNSSKYFFA